MTLQKLSLSDLIRRMREAVTSEASADALPDPASPHVAANKRLHAKLHAQFRRAAEELTAIADDDYSALVSWEKTWSNTMANCCGRFGLARIAAHRVAMAIYGGPQYSVDDGVLYESFHDHYERMVPFWQEIKA